MRRIITFSLMVALVASAPCTSRANTETELSFGSGYQRNLFSDSNSSGDAFANLGVDLRHYPSASVQLSAGANYNHFIEYEDLSNFVGDLSIAVIPTGSQSRSTVSLAGALSLRHFGDAYELYDQTGATVAAELGYRLSPKAFLRSSAAFVNTSYANADYGSSRSLDFSLGLNLTLWGSNSLALKGDFSTRSIDQPEAESTSGSGHMAHDGSDESDAYQATGFSVRYSRPLGARTGLNLAVGHRQMHVDNGFAVYGYTIDYLSPWADLWEGPNLSAGLKHIFPHQIKTELSAAWYDKSFVDVIESTDETGQTYWFESRDDKLTAVSLSLSRPISLSDGRLITPSLYLGYRDNRSTVSLYDYHDTVASASIRMSL